MSATNSLCRVKPTSSLEDSPPNIIRFHHQAASCRCLVHWMRIHLLFSLSMNPMQLLRSLQYSIMKKSQRIIIRASTSTVNQSVLLQLPSTTPAGTLDT